VLWRGAGRWETEDWAFKSEQLQFVGNRQDVFFHALFRHPGLLQR
jgi:hypothetical protein